MSDAQRILIVEDDSSIARGLAMNLRFEGYAVELAPDGDAGLQKTIDWSPDLVILDLMLPGMNGYEVCHAIRKHDASTAIVILTAKGAEDDKVLGLKLGADDYITKPFGLKELLARVDAVLRRRGERKRAISFHDVEVDLVGRNVRRGGEPVAMTSQEIRLLTLLVQNPGRVFSRQQLLDQAWGHSYEGSERTVDNFVRRLRVKLEPEPESPRHLLTVVGTGYRFEP